ncbi:deuterolysin M35 metalloprotease [Crucibulum laeve]|uniref:Deuterolysin M35 metalloprotease n=1 Tax=Crucibulum laeve TaxID=68775 RepID=A0A5C3MDK4_9AGAR|nr:deuterolysin M35 metalloprotease [Crucibulum laeve]
MFSASVRSIFVALIVSALGVQAMKSISLKVTGPDAVAGVENLKVVTTVTNTGDETLKILNDPRSALSKLPANKFSITDTKGAHPKFNGIKAKYSPETAATLGGYTVLAPGASIDVAHNLADAYNFTGSGEGAYDFEADNLFYVVKDNGKVETLYANEAQSHTARVTGNLAVARSLPNSGLTKRASFVGCTAARQTLLNTAAASAQSYASSSLSYVKSISTGTTRYTTWFGTYTSSRYSTVLSHYTKISGNTFSSYTFDCTCTDSSYAYVYPGTFGRVYLCNAFWNAPNTGTDSKAGTIIHESSHFTANGGTDDYAYGQTAAKSLATSNPARAILNADSHEYFTENNPSLA